MADTRAAPVPESVPELTDDLYIIQKLDDQPNDIGGLTAEELKLKFDEGPNRIKTYINGTLIPALFETIAVEEAREEAEAGRVEAEQERVEAERQREAKINNMSVDASTLGSGSSATVEIGTNADGGYQISFGIPKGETAFATDENTGKLVRLWTGTLAEYNALPVVDGDVHYNILEGSP